jgi:hypothetical protein
MGEFGNAFDLYQSKSRAPESQVFQAGPQNFSGCLSGRFCLEFLQQISGLKRVALKLIILVSDTNGITEKIGAKWYTQDQAPETK